MITGNMDIEDIHGVFDKNRKRISAFADKKAKALGHELRMGMSRSAAKCYDLTAPDRTEFKVVVIVQKKFYSLAVYVYCRETNLLYRCECNRAVRVTSFNRAYTVHYLRRYAERILGKPDMSINAVLASLTPADLIQAYREGRNAVFATVFGLVFCTNDEAKGVVVFRTVVSASMLKTSQKEVYRQLGGLVADLMNDERKRNLADRFGMAFLLEEFQRRGIDCAALFWEYRSYFEKQGRLEPAARKGMLEWNDALRLAGNGETDK